MADSNGSASLSPAWVPPLPRSGSPVGSSSGSKEGGGSTNKACVGCAKLKMKCDAADEQPPCSRCKKGGKVCVFNARKKRVSRKATEPPSSSDQHAAKRPFLDSDALLRSSSLDGSSSLSVLTSSDALHRASSQPQAMLPAPSLASVMMPPTFPSPSLSFAQLDPFQLALASSGTTATIATNTSPSTAAPVAETLVNPIGLLVSASRDIQAHSDRPSGLAPTSQLNQVGAGASSETQSTPGRDDTTYFAPLGGTVGTPKEAPEMLRFLSVDAAAQLFEIFFRDMHIHAPFIDSAHGTWDQVATRSHLLFHAICGVAVRHWDGPIDVADKVRTVVAQEMRLLPREKNLETIQANLIFSIWNPAPSDSSDRDDVYLRSGMAVRLALELDYQHAGVSSCMDVEPWLLESIQRTWAMCYIGDRTAAVHLNKACTAPVFSMAGWNESSVDVKRILSSVEWCTLIERVVDQGKRRLIGGNGAVETNYLTLESEIQQWRDKWMAAFRTTKMDFRELQVRQARLKFYYHYANLLNASYAMQNKVREGSVTELAVAITKCQQASTQMLLIFCEDFFMMGSSPYLPDLHLANFCFSAVSLLQCSSSAAGGSFVEKSSLLDLLHRVVNAFELSANRLHRLPALHGNFLSRLLASRAMKEERQAQEDMGIFTGEAQRTPEDLAITPLAEAVGQTLSSYGLGDGASSTRFANLFINNLPSRMGSRAGTPGADMTLFDSNDLFGTQRSLTEATLWESIFLDPTFLSMEAPSRQTPAPSQW